MGNNIQDILVNEGMSFIYDPQTILINISLAFVLGLMISYIYKETHKGLSYSQSFMLTIVFVTLIVSMVIMVIGNNLARAFALVGALSIIRFRTVIKDTKDTAYIFLGLAGGMAAGTSSYFLALIGTTFILLVATVLHLTNYGSLYKSEFILIFRITKDINSSLYTKIFDDFSKSAQLLNIEPSADHQSSKLTFDIVMQKNKEPLEFSNLIAEIEGITEVRFVASKNDKDY
jgi:uncharacterized membrane protein YhiD involved in acid resistance